MLEDDEDSLDSLLFDERLDLLDSRYSEEGLLWLDRLDVDDLASVLVEDLLEIMNCVDDVLGEDADEVELLLLDWLDRLLGELAELELLDDDLLELLLDSLLELLDEDELLLELRLLKDETLEELLDDLLELLLLDIEDELA